jgi:hypothetical protein
MESADAERERNEAEQAKAEADATMEFWKQSEQLDEKAREKLFEFLQRMMSFLQELQRNIAATEQKVTQG